MAFEARLSAAMGPAIAGMLTVAACKNRPELVVRDSEGRSFSVTCSKPEDACKLVQNSGPEAPGQSTPVLRATGRFFGVCDGAAPVHLADCRPLTCATDAECPPASGAETGTCVGALCTEPTHAFHTEDAILLCMSGTGLGHESPEQVTRYALALNCGTPCTIPKPCRQP